MTWGNLGISSMYGPGVLNDTIVPGYGVTKFPVNLTAFNYLKDGTTRNFGESTQYVQYGQPMMTDLERYLAYKFTDPNHISQWNPLLLGFDLTQGTTNPIAQQMGVQNAWEMGNQMRIEAQIQSDIQSVAQLLGSMENSLTNILTNYDKQLTNKQKSDLKKLVETIQAKKDEILKRMQEKKLTQEDVEAIKGEVLQIKENVSKVAERITNEIKGEKTNNDQGSQGSQGTSNENSGEVDTNTGKPSNLSTPKESECEDVCSKIYNSVEILGTNTDDLEAGLQELKPDNVIEIIKHWEDNYGKHTADGNSGFFARIFDDIDDSLQTKYIQNYMLPALVGRAEALGIYDEIKQNVANINKGLSRTTFLGLIGWQADHQLANDLMAIYDKIVAKEAANAAGAKKTEATDKKDDAKKVNERKAEVVAEKTQEFQNELRKNLELGKELPELTPSFSVETDEKGEFAGYKVTIAGYPVPFKGLTYAEIIKKLEDYGLDPKECLIKQAATKA